MKIKDNSVCKKLCTNVCKYGMCAFLGIFLLSLAGMGIILYRHNEDAIFEKEDEQHIKFGIEYIINNQ